MMLADEKYYKQLDNERKAMMQKLGLRNLTMTKFTEIKARMNFGGENARKKRRYI